MKKCFLVFAVGAALAVHAHAQNWTTVTATNITDLNQQKLAAGQLCFLPTDQNDNPVSVQVGGGGQTLRRAYCSLVSTGAVTNFTVPNPANTAPSGVYYRVTVKDSSTGQEVLRYPQVTFSGTTFSFDNYAPISQGNFAPLSGTNVTGNLSVAGNVTATGTLIASNIPSVILQQVFNSGSALTPRTGLNASAGLQCADNSGTQRTDCRLGTFTTVTFSATPSFDASTSTTFKLTLTANVTSSTLTGAVAGEPIAFLICQDATGGRTFVAPTNVQGWVTIPTAANACSLQTFIYDGTNAQPDGDTAGQVLAQDGTITAPSIAFENETGTGFLRNGAGSLAMSYQGSRSHVFAANLERHALGGVVGWSSNSDPAVAVADTGLSRTAAGVVAAGNGTAGNSSGTFESRKLQLDGSTSGNTVLQSAAAASGTLTLPAATDTLVGRATTDTLTNKTLGGTTPFNRLRANQGTPLTTADWTLAGLGNGSWGSTASIVSAGGTDTAGFIAIACSGTGQAVNAPFKLTFHDGAFPTNPLIIVSRGDGNGPAAPAAVYAESTTSVTFGFNGVCVPPNTYSFTYLVIGD
jgi:hypothetical protein